MKPHSYLRAYVVGIFVPTLVLPLLLAVYIVVRLVMKSPVPIERGMIFSMAVVPLLWGLWNMLWLCSHERTHLPIGQHGALFPLLLAPVGALTGSCLGLLEFSAHGASWFQICEVPYALIVLFWLAALIVYYLVWKYIVGFLNRALGIA